MIYLDTSLLVKLYVPEWDSATIVEQIGDEGILVVSDLARLEFKSAVQRRVREGGTTRARGRVLLARLDAEWEDYTRVAVDEAVLDEATAVLSRHPLRTLDAVQLASALVISRHAPSRVRFGTADRRLAEAAVAEGLPPLANA